ncbi:hypothetical protein Ptr902_12024 [Pyrenophora tritici-repentis]|nr:hypothetical protein Ptr902_12024 [Pyrenophora tritici-repentis]
MRASILFFIATPLLAAASPTGDMSTSPIEKRVDPKRCQIIEDLQCWYQGFLKNGDQVRCVMSGDYELFYRRGTCPETWGGYPWAYTSCVPQGARAACY